MRTSASKIQPSMAPSLGQGGSVSVDAEILEEIYSAITHLEGDGPTVALRCYRDLRTSRWAELSLLRNQVLGALAMGTSGSIVLSPAEADLADRVLDCAAESKKELAEQRDRDISRAFAIVGIVGGVFGLLAFLSK